MSRRHAEDPGETRNRIPDRKYASRIARLRKRLDRFRRELRIDEY